MEHEPDKDFGAGSCLVGAGAGGRAARLRSCHRPRSTGCSSLRSTD